MYLAFSFLFIWITQLISSCQQMTLTYVLRPRPILNQRSRWKVITLSVTMRQQSIFFEKANEIKRPQGTMVARRWLLLSNIWIQSQSLAQVKTVKRRNLGVTCFNVCVWNNQWHESLITFRSRNQFNLQPAARKVHHVIYLSWPVFTFFFARSV